MVGALEQTLLSAMAFFIMLAMGASLTLHDFKVALRRPYGLGIGLLSQFGFMPLIGVALVHAFQLSEPVAIGLLILSCMPGGPTSNLFTYFSKGDLALSVSMTVASTVLGVILIPLVLSAHLALLDLKVPLENISLTLVILLIPVAVGMALRSRNPAAGAWVERSGTVLGAAFIAFIALSWIPRNLEFVTGSARATLMASILLGVVGFLFGHALARLAQLDSRCVRSVTLETGIQNAPLAIAIIALNFAVEDQQAILGVVALYSLFIIVTSTLVTLWFRQADRGVVR